jgi:hypothetical protein
MGWCSFNLNKNVRDWFRDEWSDETDYQVLDVALVKRHTLYAAIKQLSTGDVFCAVYLVRWSKGYYNFSYKSMTEFSGPCEIECPERIMKLLTPLNDKNDPNGWARKWRKKVNDFLEKRKLINKLGDFVFKTKNPIRFSNGIEFSYFKKEGKSMYAGDLQQNGKFASFCRIVKLNLSRYEFDIVQN